MPSRDRPRLPGGVLIGTLLAGASAAAPPLAASSAPPPPALATPIEFESVSLEEGVSHQRIFCLHEDRRGFLWFGTMHGLVRYDGGSYRSFRHDPADPRSLSNDDIVCLDEDEDGNLWIGTYGGGVNRYDRAAGRFERTGADGPDSTSLSHGIVWDLARDAAGFVWVATPAGLDRIDPFTGRVTHHRHDPDDPASLASNKVRAVHVDRDGVLWIGTTGSGLDRFDPATGGFLHHRHDPDDDGTIGGNWVSGISEDRAGSLWISTYDGGVSRLGPDRGRFERTRTPTLSADHVNTVVPDETGALWIGTGRGLDRLDPATDETRHWRHDPDDLRSLRGDNVVAVLPDRSGVVWVATYLGGLDRAVPGGRRFAHHGHDFSGPFGPAHRDVHALLEDRAGTLWIGTAAGLVAREGAAGPTRTYLPDAENPASIASRWIDSILEDDDGVLWIGSGRGLCRWDRSRDEFRTWRSDPEDESSLSSSRVTALARGPEGRLWVGTPDGLNRFDPETGRAIRFRHDPGDSTSLAENTVLSLHVDARGRLWIGTYGGLNRIDPGAAGFVRFRQDPDDPTSLSNNYVYAFHETADGELWLGTGGGLDRFDESTGTFAYFTEKDGLPNAVITGILSDDRGDLWLSTHRGLVRFDPADLTVTGFDPEDGLQGSLFNPGASCRLATGELLFGGVNGYNSVSPERIGRNEHVPPVVLTAFRGAALDSSPWIDASFLDAIELGPRESSFTFEFAALDFRRPGRNRHAYRLEGLDEQWVDAGTARTASYQNVPPGEYVFRVKGSNADDVWNDEGASIRVTIAPPFWRTAWFAALVAAVIAATIWTVHRLRVRARLARFRELEEVRAEERERVQRRAANDFHDELGHRLTKIGLFSEVVKQRLADAPPDIHGYLERIVREARRLSDDTRDFLWTLGRGGESLHDLMIHLQDFGDELFDRTDVEFRTAGIADELKGVRLGMDSRRHITSIFKEGLNNALRHAECRHVTLEVSVTGEEFVITLTDDGKGWSRRPRDRTGGLKNMELRARKIDGTIRFTSRPGIGSTVTLTRRAGTAL